MNAAPAAVTALPPGVPPRPAHLDPTPPPGAEPMTAVAGALIVGVVAAAAHTAVARYRKGHR